MTRRSIQLRFIVLFSLSQAAIVLPLCGESNAATGAVKPSIVPQSASLPLAVATMDRERILKAADAALSIEPITITKFRTKLSEGGANDFYSNGDYWWPNPNTTNGLPYVQRD